MPAGECSMEVSVTKWGRKSTSWASGPAFLSKLKIYTRQQTMETSQQLTRREEEIIRLIAQENTSAQIASLLKISVRTVETHRKNLLLKTNASSVVGLVKYAIDRGWVPGYTYNPGA